MPKACTECFKDVPQHKGIYIADGTQLVHFCSWQCVIQFASREMEKGA